MVLLAISVIDPRFGWLPQKFLKALLIGLYAILLRIDYDIFNEILREYYNLDWFSVQLQNINSGESSTVQDLNGKVVLLDSNYPSPQSRAAFFGYNWRCSCEAPA
jgi:hypothetical protein